MTLYGSRKTAHVIAEMTAQQKAFRIAFLLADGRTLTTRQVAEMTGLTMSGAWQLMQNGSGAVEIYQDDDGRWRRLE